MEPGDLFARKYRLVGKLAEGGMGEVWAARHQRTHRDVAIKLLLPQLASHREAVERFVQEAQATGRLRHPAIVDLFDAGHFAGRLYLVMELLHGETLEQRIARGGPLDPGSACLWLSQVARGLAAAHAAGIVHRDLSSANVFLAEGADGSVAPKILDFGVSKVTSPEVRGRIRTASGAVLGSPHSMSPEQAEGAEGVDARTDLWSLGVLLYECLVGRPPFDAPSYGALLVKILSTPHVPLGVARPALPRELVELVEQCLEKRRERRPALASEVAVRLERLALALAGADAALAVLRRRATDRVARSGSRDAPVTGTAGGGRLLPVRRDFEDAQVTGFVREARSPVARTLLRVGRSFTAARVVVGGALLSGVCFGVAMGVAWAGAPAAEVASSPTPELAPVAPQGERPVALAAPNTPPAGPPVNPPAADLPAATARSLGVAGRAGRGRRPAVPGPAPTRDEPPPRAVALRQNPY